MTQTIINLGTGGAVLNGRNGSTASADSNDAEFLSWPGDNGGNYVYTTNVTFNRMTAPDEVALRITGDIDIRVYLAHDTWNTSAAQYLISRIGVSGNFSYGFDLLGSSLRFLYSTTGSNLLNRSQTISVAAGQPKWVRVTVQPSLGEFKFFTSDDNVTYTQVGSTQTITPFAIFAGVGAIGIGGDSAGAGVLASKVYRAQVFSGINGTKVLDVDTSVITSGAATSFTALTGQTVTINRSTSGRKSVAVVSPVWLFGTDDSFTVNNDALINFGESDSFTLFAVYRVWATPASFGRYIGKGTPTIGNSYYLTNNSTASNSYLRIESSAGASNSGIGVGSYVLGGVTTLTGVRNVATQKLRHYLNAVASPEQNETVASLTNASELRIGRTSTGAGASSSDMELLAVAVFRRALAADEITQINAYYQARLS
jgi:hypothetical protein